METLTGPIARIVVRYAAGALVTYGLATPEVATLISDDPEVNRLAVLVIGGAMAALAELAYSFAKRTGGAT